VFIARAKRHVEHSITSRRWLSCADVLSTFDHWLVVCRLVEHTLLCRHTKGDVICMYY